MEGILCIILAVLLVATNIWQLFERKTWDNERAELVKMIAAKNYPEYVALDRKEKPPPDHKNLITEQRKRALEQRKDRLKTE